MPKTTKEEVKRREAALQEGLKRAVGVPLALAERVSALWPPLKEPVLYGNVGCKSDIQVAVKALETAVFGAYYNVIINLQDITDDSYKMASCCWILPIPERALHILSDICCVDDWGQPE
ncbi:formimidoyltransferase-cyclodeaminase-like [Syngnathoides biaculeatus]|uniref:formimidoyltransferase-cyclodeaminase-like n=1 Tax=Syngnathoides biaculeatus TaxID=300417 RepID=UPI002ADE3516|nr:formimidoyltransferase-cyclodeaminase-like [Syngnathoides biaculeatus]